MPAKCYSAPHFKHLSALTAFTVRNRRTVLHGADSPTTLRGHFFLLRYSQHSDKTPRIWDALTLRNGYFNIINLSMDVITVIMVNIRESDVLRPKTSILQKYKTITRYRYPPTPPPQMQNTRALIHSQFTCQKIYFCLYATKDVIFPVNTNKAHGRRPICIIALNLAVQNILWAAGLPASRLNICTCTESATTRSYSIDKATQSLNLNT